MYDPADILTHPDFTEVNKTWDEISTKHKEKLHNRKVKILTGVFVVTFVATVLYLEYRDFHK